MNITRNIMAIMVPIAAVTACIDCFVNGAYFAGVFCCVATIMATEVTYSIIKNDKQ